jgi:very-short-patch-repair endonuclease
MNLAGTLDFGSRRIVSRHDLLQHGLTGAQITVLVRSNRLLRVRRDHYAAPETDRHTVEAVRVGGRLACVSAARELGIFAFETRFTHLHVARDASRLRGARSRSDRLNAVPRLGVQLHWWPLIAPDDGTEFCVGARDALAQIVQCQPRHFAVAALDTALHEGCVLASQLDEIFANVPAKQRLLRGQIDARADAGQESVLRRIILEAGMRCDIQVAIGGVGRVDLLVEGCVVVEADSNAHHKSWEQHIRDRTRDRILARQGYPSLRVLYQDIMFDPNGVISAIRELVRICREGSIRA